MAPSNVIITGSTVTWSPSPPGLCYIVTVYYVGTTTTKETMNCMNCSSTDIAGNVEDVHNITVCSSIMVNGTCCMDKACTTVNIEGM